MVVYHFVCPVDWPIVAGQRIACEQALHLRESWEVTQQQHAKGNVSESDLLYQ